MLKLTLSLMCLLSFGYVNCKSFIYYTDNNGKVTVSKPIAQQPDKGELFVNAQDQAGNALTDVSVECIGIDVTIKSQDMRPQYNSATIFNIPPGVYKTRLSRTGYHESEITDVPITENEITAISIVLYPDTLGVDNTLLKSKYRSSGLKGKIVLSDMSPFSYAFVKITKNKQRITGALADSEGRFSIGKVNAGIYDINISSMGQEPIEYFNYEFIEGTESELFAVLGTRRSDRVIVKNKITCGYISGTVIDQHNNPVNNAMVYCYRKGALVTCAQTRSNGEYKTHILPSGKYKLLFKQYPYQGDPVKKHVQLTDHTWDVKVNAKLNVTN